MPESEWIIDGLRTLKDRARLDLESAQRRLDDDPHGFANSTAGLLDQIEDRRADIAAFDYMLAELERGILPVRKASEYLKSKTFEYDYKSIGK